LRALKGWEGAGIETAVGATRGRTGVQRPASAVHSRVYTVRNRVVLFCGLVAERQYNPPSSSSSSSSSTREWLARVRIAWHCVRVCESGQDEIRGMVSEVYGNQYESQHHLR
jgi:hypothetical protein